MKDINHIDASKLITDEYTAKILVATYRRPKSAIELSQELSIPIAACYRRIHALEKAGFLSCTERILTLEGKRMGTYISNLKNAYIFFEDGKIKVRFEMKSGAIENYGGDWDMIDITVKEES